MDIHNNLVLTEHAIKRHCKRLQKEIQIYNKDFTLCESQNLFAKTLGFNNWHDLKDKLNPEYNQNKTTEEIEKEDYKLEKEYLENIEKKWKQQFVQYKDKIHQQYLTLLSQIFLYKSDVIRKSSYYKEFSTVETTEKCWELLSFAIKHKKIINFNLINLEGLNLLAIILIQRLSSPFRLELIEKTNCEQYFYYNHSVLNLALSYYSTKKEKRKILEKTSVIVSWKFMSKNINVLSQALRYNTDTEFVKLIYSKLDKKNDINIKDYWDSILCGMLCWANNKRKHFNAKENIDFMISNRLKIDEEFIQQYLLDTFNSDLNWHKHVLNHENNKSPKRQEEIIKKFNLTISNTVMVIKDLQIINPNILNEEFLNQLKKKHKNVYDKLINV